MIETINEFLSVLSILAIIFVNFYFLISSFSKHRTRKLIELENEYYDYSDDDSNEDTYI